MAADILDQSNATGTTAIGFGDTGSGRDYMCQGFCPGLNATNITAVSFYITGKDADANVGIRVWIDTCDSSSNPAHGIGGIGGSTLITNATLNTSGVTKYSLSSSAPLTPGNRYVMVFAPWNTTTNVWANSYHDWKSSTANPYAPALFTGAKRVHLDASFANPVAPDAGNDDILFETYYTARLQFLPNHLRPRIFSPGIAR